MKSERKRRPSEKVKGSEGSEWRKLCIPDRTARHPAGQKSWSICSAAGAVGGRGEGRVSCPRPKGDHFETGNGILRDVCKLKGAFSAGKLPFQRPYFLLEFGLGGRWEGGKGFSVLRDLKVLRDWE